MMEKALKYLLTFSSWGRKYRGDFLAGLIAFLIPPLVSFAFNEQKAWGDVTTIASGIGLLVTLAFLILGLDQTSNILVKNYRKNRFKPTVNIGVFNGYLLNDAEDTKEKKLATYAFPPEEWQEKLSTENTVVNLIKANELSERFDVIINPFGPIYPEINKPNMTTFRRIKKFVQDGGIFVNAGDLPFFYFWDGNKKALAGDLSESFHIDGRTGNLEPVVLFNMSPLTTTVLYKQLGIRTTFFKDKLLEVHPIEDEYFKGLDTVGGLKTVKEFRSPYRCEKSNTTLIPLLKAEYPWKDNDPLEVFDCYPIAAIKYGKGCFVLNGMALEKERPEDFKKAISAINRILKKLQETGDL
ncbi:MAG: hypothetical protein ABR909_04250 [Candidatus Bathyarchaeia archaeon]|jgi:hypothetical protein